MEKVRHAKHSKDKWKKTSKKRKSREENGKSPNSAVITTNAKPLVEYSDVSSEDLSGPEAGEIQSGEESVFSFSDGELSGHSMHRNSHHRYAHSSRLEEDYYVSRQSLLIAHSPTRRVHRIEPDIIPRSPSPLLTRHERKTSVSSRSSRSSEVRHRRKPDSPPVSDYRHVIASPSYVGDYDEMERRHRKKKEKKHKKDKKSKKKKKKSKHRSRSTSPDSVESASPAVTPPRVIKIVSPRVEPEPLSDWEPPVVESDKNQSKVTIDKLDTGPCSPVSNDSHIASPEPEDAKPRSPSPRSITPPIKSIRDLAPRESPHTPPLLPSKSYNSLDHTHIRVRERSISPSLIPRDRSLSPIKSSPFRNPSPEIITIHSHHGRMRTTVSPSRRRRLERESHRRHKKDKERIKEKRRLSRSRSPIRRRLSRSPSWSRRYHSRSPSRSKVAKRYKSRSPKNIRDRDRSPSR